MAIQQTSATPAPPGAPLGPYTLDRARGGEPDALAELYRVHGPALFALAYRLTGSEADAEDVLHDLFVGLPELLGRYDERGQLLPWLRAVTVRIALGQMRRERRRERLLTESPPPTAHATDPWNAVDLSRAIDQLSPPLRAVFVLRQLEGYAHDEIAALLGITATAARVRHLRALERLRTFLEPS